MEEKKIKVFVYGTLKKGYRNHYLLNDSTWLINAVIKGTLYSIEGVDYPAFIDDNEFLIQGEVYEVDQTVLAALDDLEGYLGVNHPNNLYERKRVMAYNSNNEELFDVYVYVYCHPNERYLSRIVSNNY